MTSPTAQPPKLLDRVRAACRVRHFSIRTEDAYAAWAERFIPFHGIRHPQSMSEPEVNAFLTHLAVERNVSASTQNQALAVLLFLYEHVLDKPLDRVDGVVRANRPRRLPVVLSRVEVRRVLDGLGGTYRLERVAGSCSVPLRARRASEGGRLPSLARRAREMMRHLPEERSNGRVDVRRGFAPDRVSPPAREGPRFRAE